MSIIARYFLILCCLATAAGAETLTGTVVGVTDGDTLTLLTADKKQVRVRLASIDAPESNQPYGARAKQELSALAYRQSVAVDVQTTDRYGRSVGRVTVNGIDVNAELVRRGAAWVYRKYSQDAALLALEADAKAAHRGVWASPESQEIPPWEWRKVGAKSHQAGTPPSVGSDTPRAPAAERASPAPSSGGACGSKRHCKEMSTCAEARHYFKDCGVSTLDRDHDGIPCESLCQ